MKTAKRRRRWQRLNPSGKGRDWLSERKLYRLAEHPPFCLLLRISLMPVLTMMTMMTEVTYEAGPTVTEAKICHQPVITGIGNCE